MRLIILLVALLIVGLLVNRQISKGIQYSVEDQVGSVSSDVPKVPQKPQDVQQFGKDINTFMLDAASERSKEIDQAAQ